MTAGRKLFKATGHTIAVPPYEKPTYGAFHKGRHRLGAITPNGGHCSLETTHRDLFFQINCVFISVAPQVADAVFEYHVLLPGGALDLQGGGVFV